MGTSSECRIRQVVHISVNEFSFMHGRSTIDAIYFISVLIEKYQERCKDLDMVFIDLEKTYDSVPQGYLFGSV